MALDLRCLVRQGGGLGVLHAQIGPGADPVVEQAGREIAPHMIFRPPGQDLPEWLEGGDLQGTKFQNHLFFFMSPGPQWRHKARCHEDPCMASTDMKTAGSPIAAVTAPPTAALA